MDLLHRMILPPELNHLRVMAPVTLFVQFLFLAFTGVALVSTVASLACRKSNGDLSRDLALVIPARFGIWFTLGVLPLVVLIFLVGQTLYGQKYDFALALAEIAPLAVIGLFALYAYRQNFNILVGSLGALVTLAFMMPFVHLFDLLARPEMWPFVQPLVPDLYNIQAVCRWLIFVFGSLLVTGGALLFVYFVWPERKLPPDAAHAAWLQNIGLSLTLAGAVALPALVVWDAAILPFGARSLDNVRFVFYLIAVSWVVGLLALGMLLNQSRRWVLLASGLAFVTLGGELTRQLVVRDTAIGDKLALQRMNAEAYLAALREKQEARYASNAPIDPKAGEKVYTEKCASCHRFDQKVVGPPYDETVPKYQGDRAKLAGFILNPVKVDPSYPAMPKLGLTRREAQAVAEYLLKTVAEHHK
jgi:cytochrome c